MINFEGGEVSSESVSNASSERDSVDKTLSGSFESADDKNKNRGNYRCSRCNMPKKGHVCTFQPIIRKRDTAPQNFVDAEVQAELDADMTLVHLGPLQLQGMPESYLFLCSKVLPHGVMSQMEDQITS